MDQDKYLQAKWTPRGQETSVQYHERRERVVKLIAPQWAEKMNHTYGPFAPEVDGTRGYAPEDMYNDPGVPGEGEEKNRAPLTTDLVLFVMWLREHTDFFSGPELDIKFPEGDDPKFYEVLSHLALLYTEE